MNPSLEYIKNRILNDPDSVMNMPTEGWDDAYVINPMDFLGSGYVIPEFKSLNIIDRFDIWVSLDEEKESVQLSVEYNPAVNFNYFTTKSLTYDGTLYFLWEAIRKLLFNIVTLGTYLDINETKDYQKNPWDYDVKYTIGDMIIHHDFGLKNINGHEMMGETNIIVLPIKFEVFKKGG